MRAGFVISEAVSHLRERPLRTVLSASAVAVGAFTLTLTSGIGAGVNQYIAAQERSIGAEDVVIVTPAGLGEGGLTPYSSEAAGSAAISEDDIRAMGDAAGVERVEPVAPASPEFVRIEDERFVAPMADAVPGMRFDVVAGEQLDVEGAEPEILLPLSAVRDSSFAEPSDAVGRSVTFGIVSADGQTRTVDAEIAGVVEKTITGDAIRPNFALSRAMLDIQRTGLPDGSPVSYSGAVLTSTAVPETIADMQDRGFAAQTVSDQLGSFRDVVDVAVLVLGAFSALALLSAGFGIVNSMLTSVQQRTRTIGLFRALGGSRAALAVITTTESLLTALIGGLSAMALAVRPRVVARPVGRARHGARPPRLLALRRLAGRAARDRRHRRRPRGHRGRRPRAPRGEDGSRHGPAGGVTWTSASTSRAPGSPGIGRDGVRACPRGRHASPLRAGARRRP